MSGATPVSSISPEDTRTPLNILLVEDSRDYAMLVHTTLSRNTEHDFHVDHAGRLDHALDLLEQETYQAVLLDLSLPDAFGAFTIRCACARANDIPILVLTGSDDADLSMTAVRAGAQAYLVKNEIDRTALPQLIIRAIDRHRHLQGSWDASIDVEPASRRELERDLLTRLPNERTFSANLADALEQERDHRHPIAILLLELDSWDALRRGPGSGECQRLLQQAAFCLRSQMRTGDILAKLDGGRFGVVLDGVQSSSDITATADALLLALGRLHTLSRGDAAEQTESTASIGIAVYPVDGDYVEILLARAEEGLSAASSSGGNRACFCLSETADA